MADLFTKTPCEQMAELILLTAKKRALKKAVFSKPYDKSIVKMCMTLKNIGGADILQAEYFMSDNKAIHKNISLGENTAEAICAVTKDFAQINLIATEGDLQLLTSKSGKQTLVGAKAKLLSLEAKSDNDIKAIDVCGNDREKNRILVGNEPFLIYLGVSDKNGRVLDKKRSKFNQINRFLEMIRDVSSQLPKGEINVCDLCCGKSYLSFAVYHYFANVLGYKVTMYGADLKSDVIEYCTGVARELGFDGLHFVCEDIRAFEPKWQERDGYPHLVISLHACDTATDVVLESAVRWGADVILSTPCCHHELNHTINCPALSFVCDYSMLRQKLCDAATDALRLKLLESEGYATEALELIDPEETPKNVMLRATKKKNPSEAAKRRAKEEYEAAKLFLLGADKAKKIEFFN